MAIGVLGSDVYDKLLVLRALRDEFPTAWFFTTDLDARLLHAGEIEWTRNLIVAAHFGLALRNEMQGEIAPFRDSYQTAIFLSTQVAVRAQGVYGLPLQPRMFEIGRTGPFDLSDGPTSNQGCIEPFIACDTPHPPPPARCATVPMPRALQR